MPARNPTDKVHYIVQGLATYPFSDFRTRRSQNKMGTIGSGEFNNRRLLAFQPSFSFQGLSEREENLVLLGCEYLNWLFAVQEFLLRQFIPSIHSVLIYDFNSSVFQQ